MRIAKVEKEGVVCLKIDGRLDAKTALQAETTVKEVLKEGRLLLLFDLSGMDYISSAGLRVILMAVKELRSKKGKVALCALTPYVKEIFDVSNFSSIIPITDTVETGLQQMR
ncbi:MAG: STAS domain-containing protein [Desulfobacterales bacterium]|jgi:anti-anti-sigma factor|nr:STAS domain-containing protein [Desulfobacterales bacterium]